MCQKNSDCGRDKWNRQGKCVTGMRPSKDGSFLVGDIVMSDREYYELIGVSHWKKDK